MQKKTLAGYRTPAVQLTVKETTMETTNFVIQIKINKNTSSAEVTTSHMGQGSSVQLRSARTTDIEQSELTVSLEIEVALALIHGSMRHSSGNGPELLMLLLLEL
jgi:hypothetical protein